MNLDLKRHSWGKYRLRGWTCFQTIIHRLPMRTEYCTKCGMRRQRQVLGFRRYLDRFSPYGGIWKIRTHVPKCEGLPDNYDVPVGA